MLIGKIDVILKFDSGDLSELAVLYSEFYSDFSSVYFGDKTIIAKEIYKLAFKGAIYNFSAFAGWRLMAEAFNHKK